MGRPLDINSANWKRVRAQVLKRDRKCFICGLTESLTVHHIVPRSEGGTTTLRNLITLCIRCHDYVESLGYRWYAITQLRNGHTLRGKAQAVITVGKDKYGIYMIREEEDNEITTEEYVARLQAGKVQEKLVTYTKVNRKKGKGY